MAGGPRLAVLLALATSMRSPTVPRLRTVVPRSSVVAQELHPLSQLWRRIVDRRGPTDKLVDLAAVNVSWGSALSSLGEANPGLAALIAPALAAGNSSLAAAARAWADALVAAAPLGQTETLAFPDAISSNMTFQQAAATIQTLLRPVGEDLAGRATLALPPRAARLLRDTSSAPSSPAVAAIASGLRRQPGEGGARRVVDYTGVETLIRGTLADIDESLAAAGQETGLAPSTVDSVVSWVESGLALAQAAYNVPLDGKAASQAKTKRPRGVAARATEALVRRALGTCDVALSFQASDIAAAVAVRPAGPPRAGMPLVVAFRGTKDFWPDVATDATFLPRPFPRAGGEAVVHGGFLAAFESLRQSFLDTWLDGAHEVLFVGHSMGGALVRASSRVTWTNPTSSRGPPPSPSPPRGHVGDARRRPLRGPAARADHLWRAGHGG